MKFNPTTYTPDTEAHRKKIEAAKNYRRLVEYRDKHLLDVSDPREPFYGEDVDWYQEQDRNENYIKEQEKRLHKQDESPPF